MGSPRIDGRAVVLHSVDMPSSAAAAVPLVVQLLSPLSESEETALLSSCSLARKESDCVPMAEARAEYTLRASVEMTGPAKVLIEITDSNPRQSLFVSRELTFEPHDSSSERARAIGLALGVLSTTLARHHPSPSPEPEQEDASLSEGRSDAPDEAEETLDRARSETAKENLRMGYYFVHAALGAEVGASWAAVNPTGALTVATLLTSSWGVAAQSKVGFSPASENRPRLLHVDVLLGPMFYRDGPSTMAWVVLSGGVTWMEARLPDAEGEHRAGSRVSPLLHLGTGLGWDLTKKLALSISPSLDVIFSPTEVYVDSERVGGTGHLRLQTFLGLTWTSRENSHSL